MSGMGRFLPDSICQIKSRFIQINDLSSLQMANKMRHMIEL